MNLFQLNKYLLLNTCLSVMESNPNPMERLYDLLYIFLILILFNLKLLVCHFLLFFNFFNICVRFVI